MELSVNGLDAGQSAKFQLGEKCATKLNTKSTCLTSPVPGLV